MFRKRFPPGPRSTPEPPAPGESPEAAKVAPADPIKPAPSLPKAMVAPSLPKDVVAPSLPKDLVAPSAGRPGSSPPARAPGRTLVVGRDIVLTGEIAAGEKLVIEGRVEGDILDTQRLEIAESGRFKGRAEVEACVVAGACEGELSVAGLLTIRAKGRVKGTVRYAEIEIQRGGRLSGDVDVQTVREVTGPPRPASEPRTGSTTAATPRSGDAPTDLELAPGTGPRSG